MPELDLGAGPGIAGVGGAHEVAPLLRGLDALAVGAGVVPHAGAGEAGEGNACKGGNSGEDVRVGAGEDLREHGAGGEAGGKDPRGVAVVLLQGVADHVDNREGVTAGVVLEGGVGVHVPTVAGVGGIRVDDDCAEWLVGLLRGDVGKVLKPYWSARREYWVPLKKADAVPPQ